MNLGSVYLFSLASTCERRVVVNNKFERILNKQLQPNLRYISAVGWRHW